MTYSEKLKNPKWQKKRLQILERDVFTCQKCLDKESTLHVHHKFYTKGKNPWEYDNYVLITLCEKCHQLEEQILIQKADLKSRLNTLFPTVVSKLDKCPACGNKDLNNFQVKSYCCTMCGFDSPYELL